MSDVAGRCSTCNSSVTASYLPKDATSNHEWLASPSNKLWPLCRVMNRCMPGRPWTAPFPALLMAGAHTCCYLFI